jgi:hypothetical protein
LIYKMTQRLPFTQASLRRAIAAARKEGLRIAEIRPDGTLITICAGENPQIELVGSAPNAESEARSKWQDIEA